METRMPTNIASPAFAGSGTAVTKVSAEANVKGFQPVDPETFASKLSPERFPLPEMYADMNFRELAALFGVRPMTLHLKLKVKLLGAT